MPIAYFQVHGISDQDFNITSVAEVMRDKFVMNNGCTAQTVANVAAGTHTHQACEYDGASGDSVQKTWVPAEAWKFFTQF